MRSFEYQMMRVAMPSRPEGDWPEDWTWPEYPERLYHATPVSNLPQIMQEGLKPMASDDTKRHWHDAQPYVHAHADPDELFDIYGDFLHEKKQEPLALLSVPAHHFNYWMGTPDDDWGAVDDGSGREQFTWFTDKHILPEEIQDTGVRWPEHPLPQGVWPSGS